MANYIRIPLTGKRGAGKFALIDKCFEEPILLHEWRELGGYAATRAAGEPLIFMHRFVTNCPEGKVVHHKNRDPLDNRLFNLEICTQAQNMQNMLSTRGASRFKGVNKIPGGYRAEIMCEGSKLHLGCFASAIEAAQQYDRAAIEFHKSFARLNLPELAEQTILRPLVKKLHRVSKYRGVALCKQGKPWQAQLSYQNKRYYLGSYDTELEAAHAYDEAARKLKGAKAVLNFPLPYNLKNEPVTVIPEDEL